MDYQQELFIARDETDDDMHNDVALKDSDILTQACTIVMMRNVGRRFCAGARVCALDIWTKTDRNRSQWRAGTIRAVNHEQNTVNIHFEGWPSKFDIVLDMNSDRDRRRICFESVLRDGQARNPLYCDVVPREYNGECRQGGTIITGALFLDNLLTDEQLAENSKLTIS